MLIIIVTDLYSVSYNLPILAWEEVILLPESLDTGQQSPLRMKGETNALRLLSCASRWWWPTLYLMRYRSCNVQKSKLWMSVWSWPRPSGASTMESPWPICSATLLWMIEATHTYIPAHKDNITKHTLMTKNQVYSSLYFNLLFLFVLLIDMSIFMTDVTEIVCIYCMLHMKQLKLCFILWYVTQWYCTNNTDRFTSFIHASCNLNT